MATLQDLKKYIGYEFSSGPYTGEDYKQFQTKYINYLRSLCKKEGWELVNIGRNHYCFSVFIKNDGMYVYLSVSDVRFFSSDWYEHILVRTAKSAKDYTGGCNQYVNIDDLVARIKTLFERWIYETKLA